MIKPLAISITMLLSLTAFADDGIVSTFLTKCNPPSGDQTLFESYIKSQVDIARLDLQQLPPKPELDRKKEILESQVNLSKSKCLIEQISKALDEKTKTKDIEARASGRSLMNQLAMYQGIANRALDAFRGNDLCLLGTLKERLQCSDAAARKHSHEQTSYNAVEFFVDVYQLAKSRNPNLTIADLGKVMEKRFEKDIKYLKDLPEPGDEDDDETGDRNSPPSPSPDDLIPLAATR